MSLESNIIKSLVCIINTDYMHFDIDKLEYYLYLFPLSHTKLKLCVKEAIYRSNLLDISYKLSDENVIDRIYDIYLQIRDATDIIRSVSGAYNNLYGEVLLDNINIFMDKYFIRVIAIYVEYLIRVPKFHIKFETAYKVIQTLYSSETVNKFEHEIIDRTATISGHIISRYGSDYEGCCDELNEMINMDNRQCIKMWHIIKRNIVWFVFSGSSYFKEMYKYSIINAPYIMYIIDNAYKDDNYFKTALFELFYELFKEKKYTTLLGLYTKYANKLDLEKVKELEFINNPQALCKILYSFQTRDELVKNVSFMKLIFTTFPNLFKEFNKYQKVYSIKNILSGSDIKNEDYIIHKFESLDRRGTDMMKNLIYAIPCSTINHKVVELITVCNYSIPEPIPQQSLNINFKLFPGFQQQLDELTSLNKHVKFVVSPHFGYATFNVNNCKIIGNTSHMIVAKYASHNNGITKEELSKMLTTKLATLSINTMHKHKIIIVKSGLITLNPKFKSSTVLSLRKY
ncbi:hypothetical protein [Cetacean poxvirus 1]|nr:hypothetical protein [Cetacean poxvirus 1]